ncbi:MAG: hypothetical protein FJ279_38165, partial [Planctomycetes bacterium]|nr:hypothetical protein [Planctomycetota bacterium]
MRSTALSITLLALCSLSVPAAGREGIPLNNYTRLGQRFTVAEAFDGLWIVVPSWLDAEGGLTLTLWESPSRARALARQSFADVPDNARVNLHLPKPLPPGSYYWEVHDRTGQTKVGLYADTLEAETEDCAFFDGKPNAKRRFVFGPTCTGSRFIEPREMVAALQPGASPQDKSDACRQLAIVGGKEAVPALAGLLADEPLSHIARYALESMPDPSVDDALRTALGQLKGKPLIGVINSVGERRDDKAVDALATLLRSPDGAVASAAAAALGKIGTPAAARALEKALDSAPAANQPSLGDACLCCADALASQGRRAEALALYDRLRSPQKPLAVRTAAMRGAIRIRGIPALVEHLHSADPSMVNVALWLAQHELPGAEATQALAAELAKLPVERQAQLIQALRNRGDSEALPALRTLAKSGERPIRLAALQALGPVGRAAAIPTLVETLADPDTEISKAAQSALGALPGPETDA